MSNSLPEIQKPRLTIWELELNTLFCLWLNVPDKNSNTRILTYRPLLRKERSKRSTFRPEIFFLLRFSFCLIMFWSFVQVVCKKTTHWKLFINVLTKRCLLVLVENDDKLLKAKIAAAILNYWLLTFVKVYLLLQPWNFTVKILR